MRFFLLSLGVHVFITALLVLFTVIAANRNKKGKVKRGIWYFMPLFLSVLAVLHLVYFSLPRMLDIPSGLERDFKEVSGKVEEVSSLSNYFVIDGTKYYYIDFDGDYPENKEEVTLRYLKNSHCVVSIEYNESDD